MKNSSQKFLLTISVILSFLLADFSIAAEVKTDSKSQANEVEDHDLKLSIEELRKKYPIDWLSKKYGEFLPNCDQYSECDSEECVVEHTKASNDSKYIMCNFYLNPEAQNMDEFVARKEYAKKVNLDFFTESQTKSVFVYYLDRYEKDERVIDIVNIFIEEFVAKKSGTDLTAKEKRILEFAFSPNVIKAYKVGCYNGRRHLKFSCRSLVSSYYNDFYPHSVSRFDQFKKIQLETEEDEMKQKFKELFFSKFN